ncbi:MAG: hypothetical protein H7Z18_02320 [Methylophilaceae bacterium]|nr:hypothetical protein [Methylophilaceae bacterium]
MAQKKIEPNKYSKNANIKADTHTKTSVALVGMFLMISGMIGLAFELFSHADTLNNAWFISQYEQTVANPMRLGYLVAAYFVYWIISKIFTVPQGTDKPSGKGNMLMYMMMVIGVYYLVRLFLTGSVGAVNFADLYQKAMNHM